MANVSVKVTRRGGQKLERLLRDAGKGGVSGIKVGFFSTAKYDDGTPVAAVAAWNEFGTGPYSIKPKHKKALAFTGADGKTVFAKSVKHPGIPERPFFRRALAVAEDGIVKVLKAEIDPERMVVDDRLAGRVGEYVQGEIRGSITALREPPNAPATIKRKRRSNPLIDTGTMSRSVTFVVER